MQFVLRLFFSGTCSSTVICRNKLLLVEEFISYSDILITKYCRLSVCLHFRADIGFQVHQKMNQVMSINFLFDHQI